jgi:hypothetical protein
MMMHGLRNLKSRTMVLKDESTASFEPINIVPALTGTSFYYRH